MSLCNNPGCPNAEQWSGLCPEHYWQMVARGLGASNEEMGASIERLQRELELERQQSAHLRALLAKYGDHTSECDYSAGSPCDCGWKEVRT